MGIASSDQGLETQVSAGTRKVTINKHMCWALYDVLIVAGEGMPILKDKNK